MVGSRRTYQVAALVATVEVAAVGLLLAAGVGKLMRPDLVAGVFRTVGVPASMIRAFGTVELLVGFGCLLLLPLRFSRLTLGVTYACLGTAASAASFLGEQECGCFVGISLAPWVPAVTDFGFAAVLLGTSKYIRDRNRLSRRFALYRACSAFPLAAAVVVAGLLQAHNPIVLVPGQNLDQAQRLVEQLCAPLRHEVRRGVWLLALVSSRCKRCQMLRYRLRDRLHLLGRRHLRVAIVDLSVACGERSAIPGAVGTNRATPILAAPLPLLVRLKQGRAVTVAAWDFHRRGEFADRSPNAE